MKIADLATVRDASDVVDGAVVPGLHLFGIFDHLVNEVAEMEDEAKLVGWPCAFILKDHPAIGVELALVDVLAADEGEVHRPRVVCERRRDRAANATAKAALNGA